jgi:hypothetical protein
MKVVHAFIYGLLVGHLWVQAVFVLASCARPADCFAAGCRCHMHGSWKLASYDSFCYRALLLGPLFPWKVFLCMRDVHAIWLWDPVPFLSGACSLRLFSFAFMPTMVCSRESVPFTGVCIVLLVSSLSCSFWSIQFLHLIKKKTNQVPFITQVSVIPYSMGYESIKYSLYQMLYNINLD